MRHAIEAEKMSSNAMFAMKAVVRNYRINILIKFLSYQFCICFEDVSIHIPSLSESGMVCDSALYIGLKAFSNPIFGAFMRTNASVTIVSIKYAVHRLLPTHQQPNTHSNMMNQ